MCALFPRPHLIKECPLNGPIGELLVIMRQVYDKPNLMNDQFYRDTVHELLKLLEAA